MSEKSLAELRVAIKNLQDELAQVEAEEQELAEARRKSVRRKWKFTFMPHERNTMFDKIHDPAVVYYILHGEVVNAKECLEVGNSDDYVRPGGMGYYYNKASGRIIMRGGGGNIYIPEDTFGHRNVTKDQLDEERAKCYTKLEEFVKQNPDGGDVTDIIVGNPYFGWK